MSSGDKKQSMSGPDLELKRAFADLQSKMVETRQKMKLADLQIENLKRSITHASLTEAEIASLPGSTKVYESVGRMFMLSTQSGIKSRLDERQTSCSEKIKTLEGNKEYLERSLKESENALRELIVQKKGVTATAS